MKSRKSQKRNITYYINHTIYTNSRLRLLQQLSRKIKPSVNKQNHKTTEPILNDYCVLSISCTLCYLVFILMGHFFVLFLVSQNLISIIYLSHSAHIKALTLSLFTLVYFLHSNLFFTEIILLIYFFCCLFFQNVSSMMIGLCLVHFHIP